VESVIKFNKDAYKNLNVDFRVIDITKDDLPQAEIVFLRQVLQHLSNEKIIAALPQILSKYKYLILTEHLPSSNTFTPNLDILTGPETRIQSNSGLVLTSAPFNLKVIDESCLCEVIYSVGRIRTTMYRLN
ncbi:MAG: SAM-dependent methyltransferase, partial [Cytophaga sp.]|nr:SAM-dependent methyltransferase [Undibacterium sp.]